MLNCCYPNQFDYIVYTLNIPYNQFDYIVYTLNIPYKHSGLSSESYQATISG